MPREQADLTEQRFGRLVAICYDASRKDWKCRCDCGKDTFVRVTALRRGLQISCGCYRRDRPAPNRTHNRRLTPEYRSWRAMKRRCLNPHASQYAYYGGRGITICQRWIDSFEAFLSDMGEKPSPSHSLDRIDNDGPYSSENCQWATMSVQMTHRRLLKPQNITGRKTNRWLEFQGERLQLCDWARRLGITGSVLSKRLSNWPIERALTEVRHNCGQAHKHD